MESDQQKSGEATAILGKRAATVASSLMITKGITFLIMGLTFIFITRYLGPSLFGVYTVAVVTAALIGALGDLGISTMWIKVIPQYMNKGQIGKVKTLLLDGYAIILIESILFTAVAFFSSSFVAQSILHNPSDTLALQLVSFSIILGIMWGASYNALIAFGKSRKLVTAVALQVLLQSFVSAGLVLYNFGPIGPILGLETGAFVGMLYAMWIIFNETKTAVKKPQKDSWRNILTFSLPIGLSSVVATITSNFSLLVLQIFSTTIVLGNFGAANKAIGILDVVLGSVGVALLPIFSVTLSDKKTTKQIGRYYNYALYFVFLFGAPLIFYIVTLSQQFSYTIFSGLYTLTPLYLAIMSIGSFLIVIYSYASYLLIGAGDVRKMFKYYLIASVVQLALLYVFVEPFGGLGLTVLMFIIFPAVLSVLYMNRLRKLFKIKLEILLLCKVIVAAIISALFLLPLAVVLTNNVVLLIAGALEQVIIYPIIISLLKVVDKQKLGIIKTVTESLPVFGYIMNMLLSYTEFFIKE